MLTAGQLIDGSQLKGMFVAGSKWLKVHMAHVNALNVFPVPDGDTGTNMFLTLQSAVKNIQTRAEPPAGEVAALASQGALMGARGNSGVILSQILDGFAEGLAEKDAFSVADFAHALQLASVKAYHAVTDPVEGTILTVIKESARAGQSLVASRPSAGEFLSSVLDTARQTLSATPDLLPVLKEAGVVDSGGQGLVYFLEGMLRHINNLPIEAVELDTEPAPAEAMPISPEGHEEGWGYDVQFLIQGENLDIDAIRDAIVGMGECPLVVGNQNTIKVHVHVPDPGVPLSYGVTLGHLDDIVVENMELQSHEFYGEKESVVVAQPTSDTAVICVAPGDGFAAVFKSLGAHAIISGGQTMNPSTQEFLTAIDHLGVENIIILPNNSNIILTAQQASSMADENIRVIPSKTVPQGIGALMSFQNGADVEANVTNMHDALAYIHTVEITHAVRTTTINDVAVREGDIIGLMDGKLIATGNTDAETVLAVFGTLDLDEVDVATLYYGQSVSKDTAEKLAKTIVDTYPHLDVEVVSGGQPHYQFIISLE